MRLNTFETDIILAQVAMLEAIDAADQRGRESGSSSAASPNWSAPAPTNPRR